MRRVVITGMGLASPIGVTPDELVESLLAGRTGVRFMPEWGHVSDLQGRLGGMVDGLDLTKRYPRKKRRTMGKVALLSTYATEQAVEQAGLPEEAIQSGRCGIAYGSTSGSNAAFEEFCGPLFTQHSMRGLDSTAFLKFMTHTCAANLAQHFKVRGRIIPTSSACTSASQGIGYGLEAIQHGLADVMICGGAEELHWTHAGVFDLFYATSTMNDRPEATPRPFDVARDGLVVAEGAGTLVLEEYEHARARGAHIHAELLGYGTSCDGTHVTHPSAEGMASAIREALADAGVSADAIDYVNAHATATEVGDLAESRAMHAVFGECTPVSSSKGFMGHTLGACGAIEVGLCVAMMRDRFIAPTKNLETVDPRCAPLEHVIGDARDAELRVVMSNNFAFGGMNTSLVFAKR